MTTKTIRKSWGSQDDISCAINDCKYFNYIIDCSPTVPWEAVVKKTGKHIMMFGNRGVGRF